MSNILYDPLETIRLYSEALSKKDLKPHTADIIDLYVNQGKTFNDIGLIYNKPCHKIKEILISNNVSIRTKEEQFFKECELLGLFNNIIKKTWSRKEKSSRVT